MEYVKLGSSDLRVSRVCMGCMGFGDASNGQHRWTVDEETTRSIVGHGLDMGINFFDTAVVYQNGTSERYLGRALRDLADRDDVVVATKFVPRSNEDIERGVSGRDHILGSLDRSLANLGMDHVDLFIYHMWDYRTPIREVLEALGEAVRSGKTRYIGISNCFAWQLAKANALADSLDLPRFVSVQNHYNLIFREEEREMAPLCREDGIAMTPYSALASGRLSRHPGETTRRLAEDSYARFKYDATADEDAGIVSRVAEVADRMGVTMTEVSLAWLLTKTTSPVVGATKAAHVDGMAGAVNIRLSEDDIRYLEEPYRPHRLVGVMAQNTATASGEEHVWSKTRERSPVDQHTRHHDAHEPGLPGLPEPLPGVQRDRTGVPLVDLQDDRTRPAGAGDPLHTVHGLRTYAAAAASLEEVELAQMHRVALHPVGEVSRADTVCDDPFVDYALGHLPPYALGGLLLLQELVEEVIGHVGVDIPEERICELRQPLRLIGTDGFEAELAQAACPRRSSCRGSDRGGCPR